MDERAAKLLNFQSRFTVSRGGRLRRILRAHCSSRPRVGGLIFLPCDDLGFLEIPPTADHHRPRKIQALVLEPSIEGPVGSAVASANFRGGDQIVSSGRIHVFRLMT
ncbi:MAG: hypothetical protein WBA66_02765 [Xanthobacteraceae bacterium]